MVTATYSAPDNDDAVVTMGGVRFFDGQAAELDPNQHAVLIDKLRANQHFYLDEGEDTGDGETFESPAPIGSGQQSNGW